MKDITRIHIAKVPYSIELSAKKELEAYIDALEAYAVDSELLQDIEIRMTELLLERGVKQEEVISLADVKAIKDQLGAPKEFMADESVVEVDEEILTKDESRKLYRNLDGALLGGVLSGMASYFRINAVWLRLIFVVLLVMSFGLFTLLYVVAWLIIPPARTAAEKLQMMGKPVTLASIRKLNEQGSTGNAERRAAIIKRVLTTMLGIGAIGMALGAMTALVLVAMRVSQGDEMTRMAAYQIPLALMFVSGILLVALSLLVAVAAFVQRFHKRIWVSAIIITALGLVSFMTALAVGVVQQQSEYEAIQRNTVELTENLPAGFASVTSVSVDIPATANINYIVEEATPSVKQRMQKGAPKVKVTIEDGTAKVVLEQPKQYPYSAEKSITIYGPALSDITVKSGLMKYENSNGQDTLAIKAQAGTFEVEGSYRDLSVTTKDASSATLDNASIDNLSVGIDGGYVTAGVVRTLSVTQPDACPASAHGSRQNRLVIQSVASGVLRHNGSERTVDTIVTPCGEVIVGDERAFERERLR